MNYSQYTTQAWKEFLKEDFPNFDAAEDIDDLCNYIRKHWAETLDVANDRLGNSGPGIPAIHLEVEP